MYSNLTDFQVKPFSSKANYVPKFKKRKKIETSDESFATEFEGQTEHLDERQMESEGTFFAIYNKFRINVVNKQ